MFSLRRNWIVAQICNLPYRRIAFGRALNILKAQKIFGGRGLKIRDTAD